MVARLADELAVTVAGVRVTATLPTVAVTTTARRNASSIRNVDNTGVTLVLRKFKLH